MDSLQEFARKLRAVLLEPLPPCSDGYLDLSQPLQLTKENLALDSGLPSNDPIAAGSFLILDALEAMRVDFALIGLNELWKAYLRWLDPLNQEDLSRRLVLRSELLIGYCLETSFPFAAQIWQHHIQVMHTVNHYLLQAGFVPACQILLKSTSQLGRRAARKGLHTSSAQQLLRSLELSARHLGEEALADNARNWRFNLEVF